MTSTRTKRWDEELDTLGFDAEMLFTSLQGVIAFAMTQEEPLTPDFLAESIDYYLDHDAFLDPTRQLRCRQTVKLTDTERQYQAALRDVPVERPTVSLTALTCLLPRAELVLRALRADSGGSAAVRAERLVDVADVSGALASWARDVERLSATAADQLLDPSLVEIEMSGRQLTLLVTALDAAGGALPVERPEAEALARSMNEDACRRAAYRARRMQRESLAAAKIDPLASPLPSVWSEAHHLVRLTKDEAHLASQACRLVILQDGPRLGDFIVATAAHTLAPSPTVDDLEALADVVGRRAR